MVSEQEFHTMVEELLYREKAVFTTLCDIATRELRSSIRRWCALDDTLRGKGHEEDILQEVHLRLIKTTVSHFLLREEDGTVNMDPAGFRAWMFQVAKNITRDFADKLRRVSGNTTGLDGISDREAAAENMSLERIQELSRAFDIVLDADVQVYKVLTWLAQGVYILSEGVSKIESNGMIVDAFGEKTLFQMRDMLLEAAGRISWLQIHPAQLEKIDEALNKPYDDHRVYGQVQYQEFFMKKGGKATISDWVNRMNSMIKRVMDDEARNS